MADAGCERIVDGRVAEGAGDAEPLDAVAIVAQCRLDPDDRIELEERQRHGGVIEVDFAEPDVLLDVLGYCVDVDLETDGERGRGTDAAAHATVLVACDGHVQSQGVGPPGLVAERLVAEDLAAPLEQSLRVRVDCPVVGADTRSHLGLRCRRSNRDA